MKVVNLRPGQAVKLGDNIVIHLHRVQEGRAALGVEAPRDILVLRAELTRFSPPPATDPVEGDDVARDQ